jgi:hypothetical protein
MEKMFLDWASKVCPSGGKYINTASTAHIQVGLKRHQT